MTAEELMATQRLVRRLPVGEQRRRGDPRCRPLRAPRRGRTRHHPAHRLGAGPARGAGADAGDAGARACSTGAFAIDRDVAALAVPVLKHRMALTFSARAEGETMHRPHRQADRSGSADHAARSRLLDRYGEPV